jgi:hypothetical protein
MKESGGSGKDPTVRQCCQHKNDSNLVLSRDCVCVELLLAK